MRTQIIAAIILLLITVNSLFARDVVVFIEDTELGLPLEGATIRSWDGAQYICDEDGRAIISVPDDRQVVIQGAYPGYENGRLVIALGTGSYTLGLRLSGIMESKELVIEATRPGSNETVTGRSVAISGRDIAQTAEIGIIEDVMNSIKLLPGVGYAGFFNAQPSIRGGDPGDLAASLDGFYVLNPYHWGGGFSIFDPRMVQSAQLSHGVFSTRYGHTISGLLDITTKKPSSTETEFELGMNTSAANFNLSLPLMGKGGILFMGRVTYYDPVIFLAQQIVNTAGLEELDAINSIRVAPYIRSGTITGNYRFTDKLELNATGFLGMDGIGVTYRNSNRTGALNSDTEAIFDYTNYQGFITTGLTWNPRNDMLLKFSAGTGYEEAVIDGEMYYRIHEKSFSASFYEQYPFMQYIGIFEDPYTYNSESLIEYSESVFNTQGRVDYDWELGNGFLFAAGVQEKYTQYRTQGNQMIMSEVWYSDLPSDEQAKIQERLYAYGIQGAMLETLRISFPLKYSPETENKLFTTSGYGLVEFTSPSRRFGVELGLRVDHYYLVNNNFTLQSEPALNPRLNFDFNVFKSPGIIQSMDISVGTGLFASMNNIIFAAEEQYNLETIKPNRSWTSVLGTRFEFIDGLNFNIEGYYKYVFDRMYVPVTVDLDEGVNAQPRTNGIGHVWGIDLMLQKLQSRFWDGWISYSFNWAKYRDPDSGNATSGVSGGNRGDDWYFPSYHRFHNLNLVLNIKPVPRINIYTRFGIASGVQLVSRSGDGPISYPVYVYDSASDNSYFIEKYYWPSVQDENNRTSPSLPMDIKFSIFGKNAAGKARYEVYAAIENVLALLYSAQGNTSFNSYTGEVDTGSNSASYEIPIPIPSFGFKISY